MARATMGDVAKRANVSKATVSHVINDTRYVEDATKARVLAAIQELGYRPSAVARGLATKRTNTIGVLISDSTNHFFGEVLRGIEEVFLPKSYGLIVCNTAEILEREAHYLDLLLGQRVDGIVAAATSRHWEAISQAEELHTPIVFVDRAFEDMTSAFVGVNNRDGARMGVQHLIDNGHRRIGILSGFDRLSSMRERFAGYVEALDGADIPLNDDWIAASELTVEGAQLATLKLLTLPERPTALFANNNLLSLGALLAVKETGLRSPRDVALVGFDDHPWAAVSDPPLTVVRQPAKQLGEHAASMLLALIAELPLAEQCINLDCELVVRRSSAARSLSERQPTS